MDICPPPTLQTKEEKAREKRKRYKARKRANQKATPVTLTTLATPAPASTTAATSLHTRIQQKRNARTGSTHHQMQGILQEKPKGTKAQLNNLLTKLGVSDPATRTKIITLVNSGQLMNTPAIQQYISQTTGLA